jgi:hypothetical protein
MEEIAKSNLKVTREEMPKNKAIEMFRGMGEDYKVAIIEDISDENVSLYRQGDWVDLCRGPHVPSTGAIKAFKLTGVAGAYWRGNEKTKCFSASTGRHGPLSRRSRSICGFSKKRRSATIANWAGTGSLMISDVVGPDSHLATKGDGPLDPGAIYR